MTRRICASLVAFGLFSPGVATGNDGAFHGSGATVFAYKEERVQMVSENIRIRHDPSEAHPRSEWAADCTFEFENLTDVPLTVQMGFPDRRAFPPGGWTIKAFETEIKGQAVKTTHKTVYDPPNNRLILDQLRAMDAADGRGEQRDPLGLGDPGKGELDLEKALSRPEEGSDPPGRGLLGPEQGLGARGKGMGSKGASSKVPVKTKKTPEKSKDDPWRTMAKAAQKRMKLGFAAAYTWSVRFAPRERLIVKNRYRFGGAGTNGPVDLCLGEDERMPGGAFWHANPPASGFGGGVCSEVSYVVTSGTTWVAPIGEATIEIDIPPGTAPNHVIPLPPATEITATTVKWHYKNFRPKEELRIVFATSMGPDDDGLGFSSDFYRSEQVKDWLVYAKANGARPDFIRRMRDIQAYSFGIRKPGMPVPSVFDKWAPPKVKEARSLEALSPVERKILALLDAAVDAL